MTGVRTFVPTVFDNLIAKGDLKPTIAVFIQPGEIEGQPAAYVCRNFVCDLPVTDPSSLST